MGERKFNYFCFLYLINVFFKFITYINTAEAYYYFSTVFDK